MADDNERDEGHYFSRSPGSDRRDIPFVVKGPWGTLTLASTSGVFSSTGLDKGTAVFLDRLVRDSGPLAPAGSDLLDLGCGSGVLALVLATLNPHSRVHAVDINPRALQLCASNATGNGLNNVVCSLPENVDPELRFHLIWSNPPIRIGKNALHEMLSRWLGRLHHDGRAQLVVGKNLGADSLAAWLEQQGHPVHRLHSSKGFRILEVRPRH